MKLLRGNHGVFRSGVAVGEPLLLDLMGVDAQLAYSIRKVRRAYSGDAIRVRRTSDNAEQNIGFVNDYLDVASLQSFVGASSGHVVTWYDQSGNGINATQTTAANQPRIIISGVLQLSSSKAAIRFEGSRQGLLTPLFASGVTEFSASVVANGTSSTQYQRFISVVAQGQSNDYTNSVSVCAILVATTTSIGGYRNAAERSVRNSFNYQTPFIANTIWSSTGNTAYANGLPGTVNSYASPLGSNIDVYIGRHKAGGGDPFNGYMSDALFFHKALTTTERQKLELNQSQYYNITLP